MAVHCWIKQDRLPWRWARDIATSLPENSQNRDIERNEIGSDAIECFDYFNQLRAKGHNVRITNNSWGGGGFPQALKDAMAGDTQSPILHALAAGNSNTDNDLSPSYPASYDLENIVSVVAANYKDYYAGFSSFGATSLDLAAPGVNILSTLPSGTCVLCDSIGYGALDGTSMATPHVAGAAALIWSAYPVVTTPQVIQRLLHNNDPSGSSPKQTATNSRLSAFEALVNDLTPPSQVTSLSATGSGLSWISLSWNAPGDDGASGSATTYDLR